MNTRPSMPAKNSLARSRPGTCSRSVNIEASQKSTAAPATRNSTSSMPLMPWAMASLPTGAMSPQKTQARNMLMWATKGRLLSMILLFN